MTDDPQFEDELEAGLAAHREEAATEAQEPPVSGDVVNAGLKLERLQKILAQAGIASRRAAEEMIRQGRVQVNGKTVTELGTRADAAQDHIRVDGKLIHRAERLRYFMLNKPRGHVTTVRDPEGRPTVMEFFARMSERLYPVGRLDYQSEGLLVVTNDGALANALTRAASGVEKTYLVKVSGTPAEEQIEALRRGVAIDRAKPGGGRVPTAPARVRQIRAGDNPWFEVVLIEGRNRELRKMFEEIGHRVEKIRRVGYGPLVLDVEPGKVRELLPEEVAALRLTAEGKLKPRRIRASNLLPRDAGPAAGERADRKRKPGRKAFQTGRGKPARIAGQAHERGRRETGPARPRLELRRGPGSQGGTWRHKPFQRPGDTPLPDYRGDHRQDRKKPFGKSPDTKPPSEHRQDRSRPFGDRPDKTRQRSTGDRPQRRMAEPQTSSEKPAGGGKKRGFAGRSKPAFGAKPGGHAQSGYKGRSGPRNRPSTGRPGGSRGGRKPS